MEGELVLIRTGLNDEKNGVFGSLLLNGHFICHTLENKGTFETLQEGMRQNREGGGMKDRLKEAALWVVAITATMFIVCSVMGGVALMIFGAVKWIGG